MARCKYSVNTVVVESRERAYYKFGASFQYSQYASSQDEFHKLFIIIIITDWQAISCCLTATSRRRPMPGHWPVPWHSPCAMSLTPLPYRWPFNCSSLCRLGGGVNDVQDIVTHPFFANINWDDLYHRRVSVATESLAMAVVLPRYTTFMWLSLQLHGWFRFDFGGCLLSYRLAETLGD